MEGNKIIMFKSGGPPLEVNINTTIQNSTDNNGVFSKTRCVTYTLGKRFLSLKIIQTGYADSVNDVVLIICEENGKGSCAKLSLQVIRKERYGVLRRIRSQFRGSYESYKDHFIVPPLPHTETFCYNCTETGSGGLLILENKVINESEGSLKATHAFIVGDDTLNVKTKITYDERGGLNVEVEEPVRLTTAYMTRVFSRIQGKMESEIGTSMLAFNSNANRRNNEDRVALNFVLTQGPLDNTEKWNSDNKIFLT